MQKNRIIANNISEEDLSKGHLSIRFLPDGFSFLLSSQLHAPILLYHYSGTGSASPTICRDELNAYDLISQFKGECTITTASQSAALIPERYFDASHAAAYLDFTNHTPAQETIMAKKIHRRPWYAVFALAPAIEKLAGELQSKPRIFHASIVMLSLADQISAADHQRGFIMAELQDEIMEVMVIRDDDLILSNHYEINSNDEALYHLLNTCQQLRIDREKTPLYLGGNIRERELFIQMIRKYIRHIEDLPYTVKGIEKDTIQQFMLVNEAVKCV